MNTLSPPKAQVGTDTPWGVVTGFCRTNPQDGLWACCTHNVPSFEDAAMLVAHVDTPGAHLITFRCRACSEPHGWRP